MKLTDLAAGIMVRPGRMEASLGRALLNKGSIKGRLTLTADGSLTDVKAQGAFERVELGSLTADLGRSRWITGPAHGHFSLEGSGASAGEIVRQTDGRASITVRHGELFGIGLNDALRLVEKRPLAASMDWKGGRTPFDLAHMNFAVNGGVGEITEAALQAATLRTSMRGRVSLPDWAVALRAHVDPAAPSALPSPLIVFDVSGALNDVTITPDARSLIERSGAAKPLFGDRVPTAPPTAPVATAQ
jgi:AsmA protein